MYRRKVNYTVILMLNQRKVTYMVALTYETVDDKIYRHTNIQKVSKMYGHATIDP